MYVYWEHARKAGFDKRDRQLFLYRMSSVHKIEPHTTTVTSCKKKIPAGAVVTRTAEIPKYVTQCGTCFKK